MTEAEWVSMMAERIRSTLIDRSGGRFDVQIGLRIPYAYEARAYGSESGPESNAVEFQTDLAITELSGADSWTPRVIIEAKIKSVTTHDAITYSQKAASHKAVHPYLRYGIALGNRHHHPLPGRLYRHGAHFDFMMSFAEFELSSKEIRRFASLLRAEIKTSQQVERLIYESRRPDRERFTVLHRQLKLEQIAG